MRKRILTAAFAAATLVSGAQAAGFYLKEQSVVGQGRAFAGSAAGTDGASAAYFNPAGLIGLEKQLEVGVHILDIGQTVTPNTSTNSLSFSPTHTNTPQKPYDTKYVPNAHFVMPIDKDTAVGIAVGAPFGSGNKYDSTFSGRLSNIEAELKTVELTASLAKRLSEQATASVGLIYQDLEITQLAGASTNVAINSELDGTSQDFGFVLGVQWQPNKETTIGASYRSQVTHEVDGTTTTIINGVRQTPTQVKAPYQLPDIFALGIKHDLSNSTRVYADATWYGWSAYSSSAIVSDAGSLVNTIVNNYQNTVSYSVGTEHDYGNGLEVRAGLHFDPTPTADEHRGLATPDADRTWISFGASKAIGEKLTIDSAFTRIMMEDAIFNNSKFRGKATGSTNILSLGLRYKF